MTKESRKSNNPIFPAAPPLNLAFPMWGKITASEIIGLLPNWLRSHDVVFRLTSNGIKNQIAANMVEHFRHHDPEKGKVIGNSICKLMETAMRDHGYTFPEMKIVKGTLTPVEEEWTQTRHVKYNLKDNYGTWDPEDLSVADFFLQCEYGLGKRGSGRIIENVSMASLGNGVKNFPSVQTGDGLDLTRCVQYAIAHPQEDLMFPRDFKKLTLSLPPIALEPKHYDAATFARFKSGNTPTPPGPAIPAATQLPLPQTSRQAKPFHPTQSKVGKAYKTSKDQAQDSRTTLKKRKHLNSLSPSRKLTLESMCNVFDAQPGTGAFSGGGGRSPAASVLATAHGQSGESATPTPTMPPRFSSGHQQLSHLATTQGLSTHSFIGQPAPSSNLGDFNEDQYFRDLFDVVGELDLKLPADWKEDADLHNPANFAEAMAAVAETYPQAISSASAQLDYLFSHQHTYQHGAAFGHGQALQNDPSFDELHPAHDAQVPIPRFTDDYANNVPLDDHSAPASTPTYRAPVARMF